MPPPAPDSGEPKPLEKHETPDVRTVEQLFEFFSMPAAAMAKTVLYNAIWTDREEVVAVLMRGDLEINQVKLVNAIDCLAIELADQETVERVTGAEVGFAGPVGLSDDIRLLADLTLKGRTNLLTGCNETGYHCLNVNLGRDCREPEFADLRLARAGDVAPGGEGILEETRGIEVGHIFKLGTKYSAAMGATFMGQNGKPTPFVMGCYGIGVSRTAQAAVEQSHDDKGIIFPVPIAPYEVLLTALNVENEAISEAAEALYNELQEAGMEVLYDDRVETAGVKFNDADLLGLPIRLLVSTRNLRNDVVEIKLRSQDDAETVPRSEIVSRVLDILSVQSGVKIG